MTVSSTARRHHDPGFLAIAILKLVKGALLLLLGIGTLSLLDKSVMAHVADWAHTTQIDLHSRILQKLLIKLGMARNRDLVLISGTSFFFAALLLTEGVGLLFEKVWAEYLTFVITGSFLPIEVYELTRRVTTPRVAVLTLNALVVAYLALRLQQRAMAKRRARAASIWRIDRDGTCAENGGRRERTSPPPS